jgi:hypothetical protein
VGVLGILHNLKPLLQTILIILIKAAQEHIYLLGERKEKRFTTQINTIKRLAFQKSAHYSPKH